MYAMNTQRILAILQEYIFPAWLFNLNGDSKLFSESTIFGRSTMQCFDTESESYLEVEKRPSFSLERQRGRNLHFVPEGFPPFFIFFGLDTTHPLQLPSQ